MKILIYHQYFISRDGAGGTRTYENGKALIEAGHSVTVVCGSGHSGLVSDYKNGVRSGSVDGIQVIQFDTKYSNYQSMPRRALSFLSFILRSSHLIFTLDYDLIFATSTPLTIGIPGILAKILRRKCFVFEVRDLWPELPKAMGIITNPIALGGLSMLEYLIYHSADRMIGLSGGMVEGIVRRGISGDKVALLPNGCDLRLFDTSGVVLKENLFDADDFVVIFAGAHGIANGLHNIINTAAYLQDLGEIQIKFLFIGHGNCKQGLIADVESKDLKNCTFLPPMPKHEVGNYFMIADVGLQALKNIPEFYNGTSPNKLYDYMAAGLPIIINYPGEAAQVITTNNLGIAVSPDNPAALGDALILLKNNPSMVIEMGLASRRVAVEKFDRKKISQSWVSWVTEGVVDE